MSSPPPQNGMRSTSRSSSLGSRFLRRSKSTEPFAEGKPPLTERKSSSSRLLRKKSSERDELARQREANVIPPQPPKLPFFTPQPQLQTFGGEMAGSDKAKTGSVPIPPMPNNENIDPYARTESMTHRGRYSYANSTISTMSNPRRVRRRKDPTPYNILVVGAKNSGKTSFLNFLKSSLALPAKKQATDAFNTPLAASKSSSGYTQHYLETEIDGERVGLTMWDSPGLEKGVVDIQLKFMSSFLEGKFEETFQEEQKVVRAPGVQDTHIHCVFLILDPSRLDTNIQASQENMTNGSSKSKSKFDRVSRISGGLDEDFDLQVLRTLQGKTTVVPVISKADTITSAHMAVLKKTVSDALKKSGLDPLEALNLDADDEDDSSEDLNRLDEREEDEETRKQSRDQEDDSSDSPGTPRTDDSDTVPDEHPSPVVKRRASHRKSSSSAHEATTVEPPFLPLSILNPDSYSLPPNAGPVGRRFPWGFADPYNPDHCDFVKLKETCFSDWRAELREASREVFYERWRTGRLNRQGGVNGTKSVQNRKPSGGIPGGILKDSRR